MEELIKIKKLIVEERTKRRKQKKIFDYILKKKKELEKNKYIYFN